MSNLKLTGVLALVVASAAIAGAQERLSDEPPMPSKAGSHRPATKAPSRKVVPPPAKKTIGVVGVRFEQSSRHAGEYATLRLQLNAPAPRGGAEVMLKAQGPSRLALPKRVLIAEGVSAFELTVKLPKGVAGDYTVVATSKLSNGKPVERHASLRLSR